jgi:hypothetical protein
MEPLAVTPVTIREYPFIDPCVSVVPLLRFGHGAG